MSHAELMTPENQKPEADKSKRQSALAPAGLLGVRPIAYRQAQELVMKFHYSQVMPKLTKMTLGLFSGERLVGACTLGWGVRPEHTIKKIFPTLGTADYLEIGKLCCDEAMPRNTESAFLAGVVACVKKLRPEIKVLYSWADAIIGKPGYVYQAANFFFGGHIWTEIYLSENGTRVHPRTMQGLSETKGLGKMNSRSYEVTTALGFQKWFGMQLRYAYPLCSKGEWKKLLAGSPEKWTRGNYPKMADLKWQKQTAKGEREECGMPPFVATLRITKDRGQTELFNASEVSRATRPAIQQRESGDDSTTTLQFSTPNNVLHNAPAKP